LAAVLHLSKVAEQLVTPFKTCPHHQRKIASEHRLNCSSPCARTFYHVGWRTISL